LFRLVKHRRFVCPARKSGSRAYGYRAARQRHNQPDDDACQCLIVFNACILLVLILLRILISSISGNFFRDVLGYQLVHPVAVGPGDVPELLVECLEDI
jgi:hypothetical protein